MPGTGPTGAARRSPQRAARPILQAGGGGLDRPGPRRACWPPALLLASSWLSLVNSIGAVSLLFLMMRKGEASKVASLFYLVPGTTASMGWMVLGEAPGVMTAAGFGVTAGAVYVCTRGRRG